MGRYFQNEALTALYYERLVYKQTPLIHKKGKKRGLWETQCCLCKGTGVSI